MIDDQMKDEREYIDGAEGRRHMGEGVEDEHAYFEDVLREETAF